MWVDYRFAARTSRGIPVRARLGGRLSRANAHHMQVELQLQVSIDNVVCTESPVLALDYHRLTAINHWSREHETS
jgi:hypothetical protein